MVARPINMKRQFIISADPPNEYTEPAWWFIFSKRKLLVSAEGLEPAVPLIQNLADLGIDSNEEIYLGTLAGRPCYGAVFSDPAKAPAGLNFQDLWHLYGRLDPDFIPIAFRALHLLDWSQKTRFCKRCGNEMRSKAGPPTRECPVCGYLSFPRISPAVIVLVERENQCLLASSPRFKGDFYSVLAGFAEPGETLEETGGAGPHRHWFSPLHPGRSPPAPGNFSFFNSRVGGPALLLISFPQRLQNRVFCDPSSRWRARMGDGKSRVQPAVKKSQVLEIPGRPRHCRIKKVTP